MGKLKTHAKVFKLEPPREAIHEPTDDFPYRIVQNLGEEW